MTGAKWEPTEVQVQILRSLAAGHTLIETALRLHYSDALIEIRLRDLRNRWGARSTVHAMAIAYQRGVLTAPAKEVAE